MCFKVISTKAFLTFFPKNNKELLLNYLYRANGGWLHINILMDFIWGHDINGGPYNMDVRLRSYIWELRKAGYNIENKYGYYRIDKEKAPKGA